MLKPFIVSGVAALVTLLLGCGSADATTTSSPPDAATTSPPPNATATSHPPGAYVSVSLLSSYGQFAPFVQVEFGTPGKKANLVLDTGSNLLWGMSNTTECPGVGYSPKDSSSSFSTGEQKELGYLSGEIIGPVYNDSLTLLTSGNDTELLHNVSVLAATTALGLGCMGGILGMGMSSTTASQLFESHGLPHVFAINLLEPAATVSSNLTNVGSMTLGGIPQGDYEGELLCVPTLPMSQRQNASSKLNPQGVPVNATKWWQIAVTNVSLRSPEFPGSVSQELSLGPAQAILDTGGSPFVFSSDAAKAIGTVASDCSNLTSMPDVVFSFANGQEISIGPEQYVLQAYGQCEMFVLTLPDAPGDGHFFVLGDPFFWKYLTVFDYEEQQVGMALKKGVKGTPFAKGTSVTCANLPRSSHEVIV